VFFGKEDTLSMLEHSY